MPRKVEISHKTIIFAVFFLIGLWFLFYIKDIILELFIAFLLMSILEPLVSLLSKIRIPRAISVLLSYILFFGIVGTVISIIVPPLVDQTTNFVKVLPSYVSNLGIDKSLSSDIGDQFLTRLGNLPSEIIQFTFNLFGNLLSVVTVLVFSFYMLLARGKLEESLGSFFGEVRKKEIGILIHHLERRLGGWARGELFLMLVVGVMTYIGLIILKVPFALPLAILAGVLEIIPYLGPILAAIPALIIGFGISPSLGVGTVVLAFLVQQTENYLLVPKIMEKSVGVSPIITLIALAIGARLAGVTGMIVSIPTVITLQVFAKNYFLKD